MENEQLVSLIKISTVENIFIDTSIFVQENFLEGNRINELLRLFEEGHFRHITSLITVNEIKNQFSKKVSIAIEEHNKAMNNKVLDCLRNYKERKERLTKFPKAKVISEEFTKNLDNRFKDAKSIILPYPSIDTSTIFEKYFSGQKPFGKADKKSEFPDAFALESLIQWCEKNKTTCIILSNDKDLQGVTHKVLDIQPDYKKFLHAILNKIVADRKEVLEELYKTNSTFIRTEVELWIRDELDDTTIYLDVTNWMDVHDIKIPLVVVSLQGYQITSIENEIITIEINTKVSVELELEIDDEQYAYKDSDDKQIYYPSTTTMEVKQEFEIPVVATFTIVSKNDYDPKIEIEELNNGKKIEPYDPYRYDY